MIQEVVREGLCTQCCFCAAVCPVDAIRMEPDEHANLFPLVGEGCTRCGLCLRICSGGAFPFTGGSSPLGDCRSLGVGYAAEDGLRLRGASGGVVSLLLSWALREGSAQRALVVQPVERGVFSARGKLASSQEEVRAAAGSWYLPVSLEAAVQEVVRGRDAVAVAGLPCHIQAWRKAMPAVPGLADKVALTVGLFCDHLVDARFWKLLLRTSGVPVERVTGIRFRGEGWPGVIRVTLDHGGEVRLPYDTDLRKVMWKSYVFTPRRCLYCYDALAEFADVSVGDPWLPEYRNSPGHSIVVARTAQGEAMVRGLAAGGGLILEPLAPERLALSQRVQLAMKKRQIGARMRLARLFGRAVPDWSVNLPRPSPRGVILGAGALLMSGLSRSRLGALMGLLPWRAAAALRRRLTGAAG